jgi:hypothetical protein
MGICSRFVILNKYSFFSSSKLMQFKEKQMKKKDKFGSLSLPQLFEVPKDKEVRNTLYEIDYTMYTYMLSMYYGSNYTCN